MLLEIGTFFKKGSLCLNLDFGMLFNPLSLSLSLNHSERRKTYLLLSMGPLCELQVETQIYVFWRNIQTIFNWLSQLEWVGSSSEENKKLEVQTDQPSPLGCIVYATNQLRHFQLIREEVRKNAYFTQLLYRTCCYVCFYSAWQAKSWKKRAYC